MEIGFKLFSVVRIVFMQFCELILMLDYILLTFYLMFSNFLKVEEVDAVKAVEMVKEGAVAIDVRTPAEFKPVFEGTLNINVLSKKFFDEIKKLDKNRVYVVYCRTGHRSFAAVKLMRRVGLKAYNVSGGVKNLEFVLKSLSRRKRY